MSVLVVTSVGDIVVDLYTDRCPLTCKNFLKLCKIKYYNGCLFHSVQKDFTAQTGDPTGTGTGGDSIYKFLYGDQARFFSDEIHLDLKHLKKGTVGMASAGENLNASQFYFTLRDDLDYLDGKHTVFGEIAEGLDTLTRINEAYVDEKSRPFKNIRVKHTYILDDPFDDPPQLAELIPGSSPEGKPKDEVDDVRLEDDWVPMDEQLGPAELEELLRDKEAHSRAVVLESIGDIPEAEIKPPDNVLFVCKLNPVTEDEDLNTIFSRFGTVLSAEIIRDYKTGDSLCYAFIEFETREACEQAYFKMDNALIDDRRIHVDFSQSVAKLWSQYRRKDKRMGKGNGCFKCGALDHMAKDCDGGSATKHQPPKYILRDNNTQRGGGDSSRYDMVFDEDTSEDKRQKRARGSHYQGDDRDGKKMYRRSEDLKLTYQEKKVSNDRHRQSDRNRGYREEEHHRESKNRRYPEVRRDREGGVDHRQERKPHDDYGRNDGGKERSSCGRDDRDYRRGSSDSDSHAEKRESGDYRKRHEDGDFRKRNADDSDRVELGDSRDYKKRGSENGRREGRKEERESKHQSKESEYNRLHGEDRRHHTDSKRHHDDRRHHADSRR